MEEADSKLGGVSRAPWGRDAVRVNAADGTEHLVTTVFDLLMARYGVSRGLDGEYPAGYDDPDFSYTPAWQEKWTGIDRKTVLSFAREWASTAEVTGGSVANLQLISTGKPYVGLTMADATLDALKARFLGG